MPAVARMLLVAACLAAAGCSTRSEDRSDRFFALGTVVELRFHDLDDARAAAASATTRRVLDTAALRWSVTNPDAELAQLNQSLATMGRATPSPGLAAELGRALELAERSGGRFDPAIGGLVRLWGFQADERPPGPPPDAGRIRALLGTVPFHQRVRQDGDSMTADPTVQFDLGGFAKGLAAAEVATAFRDLGVRDAIINLGGDLVVLGGHGDRPWRIAIRAPRSVSALAALEAEDGEAVFTSGDYERGFEHRGIRYHHILDPATGYPSRGLSSVTVVHRQADLADAAATALMVAGPDDWRATATALGVGLVLVVKTDGTIAMTDAMARRITLEVDHAGG
jgi:FAD:protein FMN transferase